MKQRRTKDDLEKRNYDSGFKKIIGNTGLLAEIAKEFVDICKDLPVDEIQKGLNPNLTEETDGLSTESNDGNGIKSIYDTRFAIELSNKEEAVVKVFMDVEGQRTDTGYSLDKRQQFYISGMIHDQKGKEFEGQEYSKLKRCYSVWVILKPKKEDRNSIHIYRVTSETPIGDSSRAHNLDLINIIVVNLGDPNVESNSKILQILNTIFSKGMKEDERDRILREKYDLKVNLKLAKRFREHMFEDIEIELRDAFNKGIEQGREEGIKQGTTKGIEIGTINTYASVVTVLNN